MTVNGGSGQAGPQLPAESPEARRGGSTGRACRYGRGSGRCGAGLGGAGTAVAQAHLRSILGYLGMTVMGAQETCVPWRDGILSDPAALGCLTAFLDALTSHVPPASSSRPRAGRRPPVSRRPPRPQRFTATAARPPQNRLVSAASVSPGSGRQCGIGTSPGSSSSNPSNSGSSSARERIRSGAATAWS